MKKIILLFTLFIATIQVNGQYTRFRLNQLQKDTTAGSILISSPTDSGVVFGRDLYISFGADTFLILGTDTVTLKSDLVETITDSLLAYVSRTELADSTSSIRTDIPLIITDSLLSYVSITELADSTSSIRTDIPLIISDSLNNYLALSDYIVDSTRLTQDSILVYYQNETIIRQDTISGIGGSGGGLSSVSVDSLTIYGDGLTTPLYVDTTFMTTKRYVDSVATSLGGGAMFQQIFIADGTTDTFTVTENSGNLPETDKDLLVAENGQILDKDLITLDQGNSLVILDSIPEAGSRIAVIWFDAIAINGALDSVFTDNTITGNGLTGSPLRVDTSIIATQGDLSDYVTVAGTQTITGAKTFTNTITQSGGDVNFDSGTLFVDENEDRVGIGTSSPSRRFEVNRVNNIEPFVVFRGVYDSIISQIYPDGVQEWNLTGNGGRVTYGTPGGNIGIVLYNDSVSLDTEFGLVNTTDYFNLRFTIDAGPAGLYIKKGGYVGVGTDSPLYDLDVNGNQRVYTSGVDGLFLEATTGSESPNIIFLSTANRYNIDNSNGTLRFFREDTDGGNGAVRMSLTDGGYLGIGTSSPSALLHVEPDPGTSANFMKYDGTRLALEYGDRNIAVGNNAGNSSSGSLNLSFGTDAGQNLQSTASSNAFIGALSGSNANVSGAYNLGLGYAALYNLTSGNNNIAFNDGIFITSGSNNIILGLNAGRTSGGGNGITTGNDNIYMGIDATASGTTVTNEIAIGKGAIGQGSNSVVLGNSAITKTRLQGDVGIGTATPESKLEIAQSTDNTDGPTLRIANNGNTLSDGQLIGSIDFYNGDDSSTGNAVGSFIRSYTENAVLPVSSQYMTFATGGTTERMRIDSDGNVGIGVTPSAWGSSFRVAMQLGGGASIAGAAGIGGNSPTYIAIGGNYFLNSSAQPIYIQSAASSRYEQNAGEHTWSTAPSGTAGDPITFTEAMTLDANGRLGIGTTSPGKQLDILQSTDDSYAINIGNSLRNFYIGYSDTHQLDFGATGTNDDVRYGVFSAGSGVPSFYTNGSERMRITSAGNVLIGTTTDAGYKLTVGSGGKIAAYRSGNDRRGLFYTNGDGTWLESDDTGNDPLYLRSPGSGGIILFQTSTTEKVRITSDGNVLIGTTSDDGYKLDVNGTGRYSDRLSIITSNPTLLMAETSSKTTGIRGDLSFDNSSLTTVASIRATAVTDNVGTNLEFHTRPAAGSLTKVLDLSSTGNVGIGVTPNAWGGDAKGIQITNYGNVSGNANTGIVSLASNAYESANYTWNRVNGTSAGLYQVSYTGAHSWLYTGSASAGSEISWTQAMTLDANGNLGLGVTPSAWYIPSVWKAMQINNLGLFSNSFNDARIMSNAYLNTSGSYTYIASSTATKYYQQSGSHIWYTAPSGTAGDPITFTQAMTLDGSGRLGIGNTLPINQLDLNKTGAPTLFDAGFNAVQNGGDVEISYIAAGQSGGRGGVHIFKTGETVGGTERMRIKSDGKVYIGYTNDQGNYRLQVQDSVYIGGNVSANAYTTRSDIRLKQNITEYENGLNDVMSLYPVYFYQKEFPSKQRLGFIAQDVRNVIPQAITDNEQDDYLGIEYSAFSAVLVKAIQEQQSIIESQASEIEQLKSQIQLILSEIEQIKNN